MRRPVDHDRATLIALYVIAAAVALAVLVVFAVAIGGPSRSDRCSDAGGVWLGREEICLRGVEEVQP